MVDFNWFPWENEEGRSVLRWPLLKMRDKSYVYFVPVEVFPLGVYLRVGLLPK